MKKPYQLVLLFTCLCILSACKKDAPEIVLPGAYPIGTVISGGSTGGGTGGGTTTTASYQPFSKNSYWKYESLLAGQTYTATYTMTGNTSQFNGKTYYEVKADIINFGVQNGYYGFSNNTYSQRASTIVQGLTVEFQYLKDNLAVGQTWTATITDNGMVNGVPGRISGKILEKDISRTVNGKTYNNVIHTSVDLEYNMAGTGYESFGTYEYYIAKGVGIIENKSVIFGTETSSLKLLEYSIK